MTATETKHDFELLLLRLERNHTRVIRLSQNLNSYKYEPRNYECFANLRDLRSGLSNLAKEQEVLLGAIKNHNLLFDEASKRVEDSIQKFGLLEQDMAAYLLKL